MFTGHIQFQELEKSKFHLETYTDAHPQGKQDKTKKQKINNDHHPLGTQPSGCDHP